MRKFVVVFAIALLAAFASGCSSDSEGAKGTTTKPKGDTSTTADAGKPVADLTAEDYAGAFEKNLTTGDADTGQLVISEEAARCVAPKFVEAITVETLHEHKATVEQIASPTFDGGTLELSTEQGAALVAAFEPCGVDIIDMFARSLTMGLTDEQRDCAAENIDRKLAAEYLATTFGSEQDDALFEQVGQGLIEACDLPTG